MLLSKVHSYTDGGDCHARPTSTLGAVWGSISCPRTLQHRDEGSGTSDHPITRRWALPLSHSCPQTRQQIKATLLRNDTPVAVNLFKIHCNILSSRSWTEIEKFNKLQKTFSRFLKAEKVFFFFFFSQVTQGLAQWLVPPHCTAVHEWLCQMVTAFVKVKVIPYAHTNSIHYTSYNEGALDGYTDRKRLFKGSKKQMEKVMTNLWLTLDCSQWQQGELDCGV